MNASVAEPTFWLRVYLLWTFSNFHQLSPLLLNPRQTALINNLFRQRAVMGPHEYEPRLEIGIVENFVPPAIEIDTIQTARTNASRTMKTKSPEQVTGQSVAPRVIPIAASSTAWPISRLCSRLSLVELPRDSAGPHTDGKR